MTTSPKKSCFFLRFSKDKVLLWIKNQRSTTHLGPSSRNATRQPIADDDESCNFVVCSLNFPFQFRMKGDERKRRWGDEWDRKQGKNRRKVSGRECTVAKCDDETAGRETETLSGEGD